METFEVYFAKKNGSGWEKNVFSIKFKKKENADTFIGIMKDEGYEITQFCGEGYIGLKALKHMGEIIDYIYDLKSRPNWIHKGCYRIQYDGVYLDIVFDKFHIKLFPDEPWNDTYSYDSVGGFGKQDLQYAVEIIDNRDKVLEIAKLEEE